MPLSTLGPRRSSIREFVHGTHVPEKHSRGLLMAPDSKFWGAKFFCALAAEFLGTLVHTYFGSVVPTGVEGGTTQIGAGTSRENWAPWGNGLMVMVMVYATANVSGGHLNPAVTMGTLTTGHITLLKGLSYMVAQVLGAIFGLLLVVGLVPGVHVQMGDAGPGCFYGAPVLTYGQMFGWEGVMTWVLVSVVFAVAVGEPSFGNLGPLAVGVTVTGLIFCGGSYTGTAINPARVLAPSIVYGCHWSNVVIYVVAEMAAGCVAGLMSGPLYGLKNPLLRRLMPWSNATRLHQMVDNVGATILAPLHLRRPKEDVENPAAKPYRVSCPESLERTAASMPTSPFSLPQQASTRALLEDFQATPTGTTPRGSGTPRGTREQGASSSDQASPSSGSPPPHLREPLRGGPPDSPRKPAEPINIQASSL